MNTLRPSLLRYFYIKLFYCISFMMIFQYYELHGIKSLLLDTKTIFYTTNLIWSLCSVYGIIAIKYFLKSAEIGIIRRIHQCIAYISFACVLVMLWHGAILIISGLKNNIDLVFVTNIYAPVIGWTLYYLISCPHNVKYVLAS